MKVLNEDSGGTATAANAHPAIAGDRTVGYLSKGYSGSASSEQRSPRDELHVRKIFIGQPEQQY